MKRNRRVVDAVQVKRGDKWIFTLEVLRRGGDYRFVFSHEPLDGADREYAAAELERWLPDLTHDERYDILWGPQ